MGRSYRIAALLLLSLGLAVASVPGSTHAVDEEIPACEDVFACVVFDPPAAAPGTTVTITPDPVSSDGFIPIVSECPAEGGLRIDLDTATASVSSSLVGDDQMATFVVPDLPPGDYDAFVFCSEINLGMIVGVFHVLAVEPPQWTPPPTPETTPTPAATPTPTPIVDIGDAAQVVAWKAIDEDGDPDTFADEELTAGWTFSLDPEALIFGSDPVTGEGEGGYAWFAVSLELDPSTEVTITEDLQAGYELIDAYCMNITGDPAPLDGGPGGLLIGNRIAELEGPSVTFTVNPEETIGCVFVNSLVPEESLGGGTGTPTVTLPPTDTLGGSSARASQSWQIMLIVMTGLLTSALMVAPKRTSRRRRSGHPVSDEPRRTQSIS